MLKICNLCFHFNFIAVAIGEKEIAMIFTLLLLVTAITIHPSHCQPGHLRKTLEEALINNTENLITLQDLFYPPQFVLRNTVIINVNVIVSNVTEDWGNFCSHNVDCTELPDTTCQLVANFSLSWDSNSFSHSRLERYIYSENVTGFLYFSEFISFLLIEAFTFSRAEEVIFEHSDGDYYPTIYVLLNDFDGISSCRDIFRALFPILSWVSGYIRN